MNDTAARSYANPWIPKEALAVLESERGSILDFGGGASPYFRASHVLDIIPFDAGKLQSNAWGGEPKRFEPNQYTSFDVCSGKPWPFADQQFDLGLTSHTLEDLRDPIPALRELGRVCKQILIITPSRLLEQTRGIDHPRYSGFFHHPWAVSQDAQGIVFRRKTSHIEIAGCHLICPHGMTLPVELGAFMYHGPAIDGRESMFWSVDEDVADLRSYLDAFRNRRDLFIRDSRPRTWKRWIYRQRRKYLGVA